MGNVIGLFPCKQNILYQMEQLDEAGIDKRNIRIYTQERVIPKLLGKEPSRVIIRFAAWGTFLGMVIYGIFALVAGWCECNIFHFSQSAAMKIIVIGILFGIFSGGFIGAITGVAESEKDTHLYTQGIRMGDTVFVVSTETGEIEKAKSILRNIGCIGVRTIPLNGDK